jgi:hypothetical protein
MTTHLSSTKAIIAEHAAIKTERVMTWLFEQESLDATVFHLKPLFDPMVLPDQVQLFLLYLENQPHDGKHIPEYEPEEIRTLVNKAFTLCGEFLATPQSFIARFVFEDDTLLTDKEVVLKKLTCLGVYPHYREFLHEWVLRQSFPLDKKEFIEFTFEVDRLTNSYLPIDQLSSSLLPLFEFFKEKQSDVISVANAFIEDKHIIPEFTPGEITSDSLAIFIKEHISSVEFKVNTDVSDAEIDYPVFLDELKQAGINLPPPMKLRSEEQLYFTKSLPVELFIGDKLKRRTIEEIFHGNSYEYERMIALINNAMSFEDAVLNLETVLHLQNARPSPKRLAKLERSLRMKFSLPETTDAIR